MVVYITGHFDLTEEEFNLHYKDAILEACKDSKTLFIVGDCHGADKLAIDLLRSLEVHVVVYHMFKEARNGNDLPTKGGYESDYERDLAMIEIADKAVGWVRKGREKSATARNIKLVEEKLLLAKARYFVLGNGDEPRKIQFNFEAAKKEGDNYIDIFDADGNHLKAYMRVEDDIYTDIF